MVLRKIKERIKKATQRVKKSADKMTAGRKRPVRAKPARAAETPPVPAARKEPLWGAQEVRIETSKFSTPAPAVRETRRPLKEELPGGYGRDRIVLQIRDPWWLHAYWEVVGPTFERLKRELGEAFNGCSMVLRVYDVSHIVFDGSNAHRFFDTEVGFQANSWYVDTAGPGRSWCADIGLRLADGRFITIARSNTVYTPLAGPSWITDEEWMIPEEAFARLYGMGFGFGRSSPVGKAWQERMRQALFSGILSSPGLASMASPVKKIPRGRKFWFVLNTELIVYGATEPDARVTVQGREIQLRPDGTFSLRFALPDGKQVIPCTAESADGVEERTITPTVTRATTSANALKKQV